MFSGERNDIRQVFYNAWRKYREQLPLEPLEAQLVDLMVAHPEYHAFFENLEQFQEKDFPGENPFLHLGLHLSIREQVSTNRPTGIVEIYQALCQKQRDPLQAEHQMMECLGEFLWQMEQDRIPPDEKYYLDALRKL